MIPDPSTATVPPLTPDRPAPFRRPALRTVAAIDAERAAAAAAWAVQLCAAMATLPVDQRVAVRLVYFEQLTQRAAAARAGVPEPEFATALSTGMRAIASQLTAPAVGQSSPV